MVMTLARLGSHRAAATAEGRDTERGTTEDGGDCLMLAGCVDLHERDAWLHRLKESLAREPYAILPDAVAGTMIGQSLCDQVFSRLESLEGC